MGWGGRLFEFKWEWERGGVGGRLFEAGRLLTFPAFRMGAYSRWALIRGWALIRVNSVYSISFQKIYIYTLLGVIGVSIDGLQFFTWNANTTFPSVIR